MTPEDARTRWCPFTRLVSSRVAVAFNRAVPDDIEQPPMISKACCCIAEDCMMWTGSDCGLKR